MNIPAAEKGFLLLRSDTLANHTYAADHVVPNTASAFDALDYYAYYRLLDALCDYTFNGSLAGKNVALGHGSAAQVTMPAGLKPLISSSNPTPRWPQGKYQFPCNDPQNPRLQFSAAMQPSVSAAALELYPNPAATVLTLRGAAAGQPLRVFNVLGSLVLTAPDARAPLAVAALPAGRPLLSGGGRPAGAVLAGVTSPLLRCPLGSTTATGSLASRRYYHFGAASPNVAASRLGSAMT